MDPARAEPARPDGGKPNSDFSRLPAIKGGWRPTPSGQLVHQIARLEAGGRRISLAVLTDANPTHDYGVRTVEGVAAHVLEDLPALRSRPSVSRPATGHGA